MTDLELRQRLSAWHHDRFDADTAPEELRAAILAIPEARAATRGPVAEQRRLSRPVVLLVAAALLLAAVAGVVAVGRLTVVPEVNRVPVDFAALNPCEVLGFGPTVGGERHRGTLELSDQLEHTSQVTTREFESLRRGERLPAVAPPGRCDYQGGEPGRDSASIIFWRPSFTIEFRAQETTISEALEIIHRYNVFPQTPTELAPIGRARVWQSCRARSAEDGFACDLLFVSADPYFFVISDDSFGQGNTEPLREIAAQVLDVLSGAR